MMDPGMVMVRKWRCPGRREESLFLPAALLLLQLASRVAVQPHGEESSQSRFCMLSFKKHLSSRPFRVCVQSVHFSFLS